MNTDSRSKTPDLPVSPRGTILWGLLLVAAFLGGFAAWAATAPLAEAVVAVGALKVDSSRKQIQHLEGGTVSEILVRDGARVAAGDVLVRLDRTRAAASLAILEDGYHAALAQEARLLAERDGLTDIVFPPAITDRPDDENVTGIIKSQQVLFDARRGALEGEIQILHKQIEQLREDIAGYRAQIKARRKQLGFVRDELGSMRELQKKGLTGKQRLLELEREAAEIEGELAELESGINATETEIARKELEVFQVGKGFRQGVVDELKQVQAEIFDLRERLTAARYVVEQTEVRAPVDGIVVSSGVHTIGGVVSPGETLLELVPMDDELIVEARIDPQDIDRMVLGLPAGIRFTAFNQRSMPELAGRLAYISADALFDQQTGVSHYIARIEVPEAETARLQGRQLQPGMMAEVFVRTGERTMADYLIQPLRDSFRRAWLEE